MAAYDENEFISAGGEIPCEFCDLLWPFELYVQHVTGCRPDLTSSVSFADYELEYNEPDDIEHDTAVSERSATQVIDDVLASEVQKLSATLSPNITTASSSQNTTVTKSVAKEPASNVQQNAPPTLIPPVAIKNSYEPKKETVEIQTNPSDKSKQNKQDSTPPSTMEINEPKKKFEKNGIRSTKEDIFNEMKGETLLSFGNVADTSKFLDNETQDNEGQDEAEDVEDINNLSDVDCDETLEEFWEKARHILNRQRVNRR